MEGCWILMRHTQITYSHQIPSNAAELEFDNFPIQMSQIEMQSINLSSNQPTQAQRSFNLIYFHMDK
jgi:hypothetical protein